MNRSHDPNTQHHHEIIYTSQDINGDHKLSIAQTQSTNISNVVPQYH